MNQAEMRRVAIGAARSECRRLGIELKNLSPDDALDALDDICRIDPELVASLWYGNASDTQIKLFRKEWRK